jgi:hypothetical protein
VSPLRRDRLYTLRTALVWAGLGWGGCPSWGHHLTWRYA